MPQYFKNFLGALEQENTKIWAEYVKTSDEFDHVSAAERRRIAADPTGEIGVRYRVEIQEVYAIYENGTLVGYVYDCANHVDAAIIQDGSGIVLFLDKDLKVIGKSEWQA